MVDNQNLLLDTNMIIAYFKGDESAKELLEKYTQWHLPVTVVGELLFGALNSGFPERNLNIYKEFIS